MTAREKRVVLVAFVVNTQLLVIAGLDDVRGTVAQGGLGGSTGRAVDDCS